MDNAILYSSRIHKLVCASGQGPRIPIRTTTTTSHPSVKIKEVGQDVLEISAKGTQRGVREMPNKIGAP